MSKPNFPFWIRQAAAKNREIRHAQTEARNYKRRQREKNSQIPRAGFRDFFPRLDEFKRKNRKYLYSKCNLDKIYKSKGSGCKTAKPWKRGNIRYELYINTHHCFQTQQSVMY